MRPSVRFVLVCVCLLYAGIFQTSASQAAPREVSSPPLWRLEIPRNEPPKDFLGPRVVSDQARVFYLQGGQVKAVNAATGRQLWTYPIGKWAQLRYSSGWLLAITHNGKVVALEAQTGRVRWSKSGNAFGFDSGKGEILYLAEAGKLSAVNLETGKTRWQTRTSFGFDRNFTVVEDRIFVPVGVIDTFSDQVEIYNARTGKRLGKASRMPLATLNDQVFAEDNWFLIDYPDDSYINVYSLKTAKLLERRTYSVTNRVRGNDWNSKVAVNDAVYISGGGNVACFPLSAPGGRAKPNFIRVPRGDVQWLAGPHNGTFLLEWRKSLWLVRQNRKPCQPIVLQKGKKLGEGSLARISAVKNGLYIGLRNGTFYGVNTKTGRVVLELALHSYAFGPTHVVGNTLVIQAGNRLLAYPLPAALNP